MPTEGRIAPSELRAGRDTCQTASDLPKPSYVLLNMYNLNVKNIFRWSEGLDVPHLSLGRPDDQRTGQFDTSLNARLAIYAQQATNQCSLVPCDPLALLALQIELTDLKSQ